MSSVNAVSPRSTAVDPRLTEVTARLVEAGTLSQADLLRAERAAQSSGTRLDRALRQLGLVSDDALLTAFEAVLGLPRHDGQPPDEELQTGLSPAFLEHARCLPLRLVDDVLTVGVEDPLDDFLVAALSARTGYKIERRLMAPGAFDRLKGALGVAAQVSSLAELADFDGGGDEDASRLKDLASDAPIIRLVNTMIEAAIEERASDIHLTATAGRGSRLRFRVDGVLRDMEPPSAGLHAAVISRIKIMAGLDIAERRLPQDGRMRVTSRGRPVDIRVATMPHAHGEGAVLRVLDRSAVKLSLADLGFDDTLVSSLDRAIAWPHGLFLVTGPTGSGKTTTLYSALLRLASPERNIVTVEDPVEFDLPGVNQVQVARKIGLDFAGVLRAVLRQDPDVIMVGEIRDRETASVAMQAALTGHLVLATVHTNTAAGAVPRLIDMGIEPYLLASTLRGALSQRLVRKLCVHCRKAVATVQGSFECEAVGCASCHGTGYKGRAAIGETLEVGAELLELLSNGASEGTLAKAGVRRSLAEDGWARVASGETSRDELRRVIGAG